VIHSVVMRAKELANEMAARISDALMLPVPIIGDGGKFAAPVDPQPGTAGG